MPPVKRCKKPTKRPKSNVPPLIHVRPLEHKLKGDFHLKKYRIQPYSLLTTSWNLFLLEPIHQFLQEFRAIFSEREERPRNAVVHEHGLGGFKIGVGQIHFRDGANDLALRVDIQKTSGQAAQRIIGGVDIDKHVGIHSGTEQKNSPGVSTPPSRSYCMACVFFASSHAIP